MSLTTFFARIGPMLEGHETPAATRPILYGAAADSVDAKRIDIYARFCRIHRFEVIEGVYEHCRAAVLREAGLPAWEALVERYFRAHPMHHVELNENGAALPSFLVEHAPAANLPTWLPALADFEWWEWRTSIAPVDPGEPSPEAGPLRIAPTVELRPYPFDLVGWLDAAHPEEPAGAPEQRDNLVLFWRDEDDDLRREEATEAELAVLKAVSEGAPLPVGEGWQETAGDLREAGILVGNA